MSELLRRVPPHDPVSERCVVAAVLVHPGAHEVASSVLSATDFYLPRMASIYEAASAAIKRGVNVDSVAGELAAAGVADANELASLVACACAPANVSYHSSRIKERSGWRDEITRAARLQDDLFARGSASSPTPPDPPPEEPRSSPLHGVPAAALRWLGAQAAAAGPSILAAVLSLASASESRSQIQVGAHSTGAVPAPENRALREKLRRLTQDGTAQRVQQRAERRVQSTERSRALEIVSLASHGAPGQRTVFDVTVRCGPRQATILGVSGKELRSYSLFADRAIESRIVLPVLGKDAAEIWNQKLTEAMDGCVETPERHEESVGTAAEDVIASFLDAAAPAEDSSDLVRGCVVTNEDGSRVVSTRILVERIRAELKDDRLSRSEIVAAVERMGAEHVRFGQVRSWKFPKPPPKTPPAEPALFAAEPVSGRRGPGATQTPPLTGDPSPDGSLGQEVQAPGWTEDPDAGEG